MHPGDVYFFSANSYVLCVDSSHLKKVTPKGQSLNPNANVFQSKSPTTPTSDPGDWPRSGDTTPPPTDNTLPSDGHVFMNGDVGGRDPPGVTFPPTPESPTPSQGVSSANGSTADDTAYTSDVHTVTDETVPLEGNVPDNQLRGMLRTQLEYYFSRENLANDSYLISQMDADQYVLISTIANFNQVKKLTSSLELVVQVLRESSYVQVDEKGEKVRPLHKRCIVILREVPESTPVEDVQKLFSGERCPPFISCEFAHNNSWYVTFDSDEDAQKAYQYLREEVRTFLGRPIMARIKAKPLVRSTFVPKNGVKQAYDPNMSVTVTQTQQRFPAYPQVQQVQYVNGGQQSYPFFPPNTVMPAWPSNPPAPAPYFDPGLVFAANGYTPGGTFKLNTSARSNPFPHSRNRNPTKAHKNDRGSNVHERHQVANSSSSHSGVSRSSPRSDNTVHGPGGPRRTEFTHGPHSNPQSPDTNDNVAMPVMDRHSEPPAREQSRSEVPPRRPPFRRRGRREEEGARNRSSGSHPSVKDMKPAEAPNFDLESTAFPPLPGSSNSTNAGEVFENKMSDVVKGTAKPLTREVKTQTQVPQSPTKETAPSSPPASAPIQTLLTTAMTTNNTAAVAAPTKVAAVTRTQSPPIEKSAVETPTSTPSLPTPPQSPQKVNRAVSTSDQGTMTSQKSLDAGTCNSTPPSSSGQTTPVALCDKDDSNKPTKLSYAQMVQRAAANKAAESGTDQARSSDESDKESTPPAKNSSTNNNEIVTKQALRENSQTVAGDSGGEWQRGGKDEPRDQRPRAGRRSKENREDRRDRDRDRRRERERDLPTKSFAK